MTADGLEKLTGTIVDCWNRGDWARYRTLTGPGFVYREIGTGRCVEGVENVLLGWGRLETAFPDAVAEIVQIDVKVGVTVVEVIWRATQTGPLHAAADRGSPSYKKLQVWDLIAMEWRNGKVVAERHQLGFLSLMAPLLDATVQDRIRQRQSS